MEQSGELQSLNEKLPRNIEWVFIGCGSSFYLAQAAAASWSILTGEKSRALPASEITLFPQLFPVACQPVLITRSGYTSEALQAAEYLETKLAFANFGHHLRHRHSHRKNRVALHQTDRRG